MTNCQEVVIARPIESRPQTDHFRLTDCDMPAAGDGEVLVKVHYVSLDPYVGSTLRGRHMGHDAGGIGTRVMGLGVGEVLESKAPGFKVGDIVAGECGWGTHSVIPAKEARLIPCPADQLSLHLGVLGMPGLTAWAGMTKRARARAGDRVLISSAAGPVGGTVGQIARIKGAEKVVGLAGAPEKCQLVTDHYGFDACINYKDADWKAQIAEHFPDGITVYWDNVGGELLQTALENLALYGRVVLCGLASQYHAEDRPSGPNPGLYIGKRAELYGLVVYDFYDQFDDFTEEAVAWLTAGSLAYREDVAPSLAEAPAHFEKLMRGQNIGKAIVKVV